MKEKSKENIIEIGKDKKFTEKTYNDYYSHCGKIVVYESEKPFAFSEKIDKIINNSDDFVLENGILYDKNKRYILCVTNEYNNEVYKMPDSVISIGRNAFENNSTVKKVIFNKTINQVGMFSCANSSVEEFIFNDSLKYIGTEAFVSCRNLRSVVIPKTVKLLCTGCFRDCESLERVEIESNKILIDVGTFYNSKSLKEFRLVDNKFHYGPVYIIANSGVEKLYISEGIKYMCIGSIEGCLDMKEIHLPTTLTDFDAIYKLYSDVLEERNREIKFYVKKGAKIIDELIKHKIKYTIE